MEDLIRDRTSKTPSVHFNFQESRLEISGVSIPEDADHFYAPLMEWVDEYIGKKKNVPTTVILRLIYFNTSTSDYLVTILKNLKGIIELENLVPDPGSPSDEPDLNGTGTFNLVSEIKQDGAEGAENKETETREGNAPVDKSAQLSEEKKRLLRIEWHYEEEDEDMRDTGSHFESIIDVPFVFKACEELE